MPFIEVVENVDFMWFLLLFYMNKVNKFLLDNKKLDNKNQEITEHIEHVLEPNKYLQEQLLVHSAKCMGKKRGHTIRRWTDESLCYRLFPTI